MCPSPLRFNLSHTRGLVACAVALARDVGVDVERIDDGRVIEDIAPRFFSPVECDDLFVTPPNQRRERFYTYWTLKEAYIKARGLGTAIPLDKFSFHIDADRRNGITIDRDVHDPVPTWQFAARPLGDRHRLAVAAQGNRMQLSIFEATPPGAESPGTLHHG